MSEPKKYWLINDVVSYFAPYIPYGTACTEVLILHDHFDMMVVVDKQGNIFHSRTDNLTTEKPSGSSAPTKIESVPQAREPLNRRKKPVTVIQNNLF